MKLWSRSRSGAAHNKPESEIQAGKKKLVLICVAIAAVIIVAIAALSVYAFSYDKAFAGVTVGGESVSGKTAEEIEQMMTERGTLEYEAVGFDITVNENTTHVTAADFKAARDSAAAAKAAMDIGRVGSIPGRLWTVFTGLLSKHDVPLSAMLDAEAINAVIAKIAAQNNIAPVDAAYKIEGDTMTLTPAVDGVKVDEDALREQILQRFNTEKYENIVMETVVAEATRLNMDEVYKAVHTEVQNAKMSEEGGEHKIVPHVVGIDFDLQNAKEKLAASPDATVKIPLAITNPKVTTIMLQSTLFQDTLSEVTTYFSPKKVARTHNVNLAAKLINGTVLNPGETFSYNKTVGPRTAARGFREAQIFSKGEIVDGLGGGICQVSSTLYMAAMKADMKTVSRKNHSFYVDYAPKGQDATVVYGSIDYKFQNTSEYPIKIVAVQKNNYIRVTIKGTKTKTKTVKISTKVLSTKPFGEKVIEDSTLKPGQRVVEQKGQEGITMEVYRSVYDGNGKLITSYLENKTRYVPLTQIVRVGPASSGAAATVTPPAATTPEKPAPEAPAPEPEKEQGEETKTEEQPAPETEQAPSDETPETETPSEQPSSEQESQEANPPAPEAPPASDEVTVEPQAESETQTEETAE